jgi:hypothetical protein
MTTSPLTHPRFKTALIIAGSVLVMAGIAGTTILLLKHFTPVKMTETTNNTAQSTLDNSPQQKAEALFAKGDFAGAKTEYERALDKYKAEKNDAAAKDVEMQLQILESTSKAQQEPQNTNKTRIVMGSQQQ